MPTPPVSDEVLHQTVQAYLSAGKVQTAAADALGISRSTLQGRLKTAARRGLFGPGEALPGYEITATSTTYDRNGEVSSQSFTQKPEAGGKFNVPTGHVVKGVSTLVDGDGNVRAQWYKTREGERDPAALAQALQEAFEGWNPPAFPMPPVPVADPDLLTIYPLADLHLSLRATEDECGEDYDLRKATDRFRATTAKLFERSPNSGTALILNLGDFTHQDDDLAMTPTSKNILQVSDRFLDTIKSGVELLIDHVYLALTKHKRVILKCLKGNHDLNAWVAVYVALAQHFRDNERVTVDGGGADYWFFRWGLNLIGAHHGHRLKQAEMAGAMATECAEDWGQTLYRLFLHGHLHHEWVKEVLGVRVECMRTLASQDAYHAGKYSSGRSLISITLHKEHGEDSRAKVNLPPVRRRAFQLAANA